MQDTTPGGSGHPLRALHQRTDMLLCMRPRLALVCLSSVAWIAAAQTSEKPQGDHIYRIGEVGAPIVIQHGEPEFPSEACEAGRGAAYRTGSTTNIGAVALSLVVGTNGRAQDMKVIRTLGLDFNQQAIEALRTFKFKPAMKDGRAVPVYATIEVHFDLPRKCFPAPK